MHNFPQSPKDFYSVDIIIIIIITIIIIIVYNDRERKISKNSSLYNVMTILPLRPGWRYDWTYGECRGMAQGEANWLARENTASRLPVKPSTGKQNSNTVTYTGVIYGALCCHNSIRLQKFHVFVIHKTSSKQGVQKN